MTIRVLGLGLISRGASSNGQARANARLRKGISVSLTRRECLHSPASRLLAGVTLVVRKDSTMGYDIVTVEGNAQEAADFAKHYNYTYLFDKDGNYVGGDQVYFRCNIWFMRYVAAATAYVLERNAENVTEDFYNRVMNTLSFNDGEILTPEDINLILDGANSSELDIQAIAKDLTVSFWNEQYDGAPIESEVNKRVDVAAQTIEEWFSYLSVAKDNGGLQVW